MIDKKILFKHYTRALARYDRDNGQSNTSYHMILTLQELYIDLIGFPINWFEYEKQVRATDSYTRLANL